MGLNYLLHRHQISLMRAKAATCVEARRAHETFAARYATLIDTFRREKIPKESVLSKSVTLIAA
jgi:hypothetical protein